MNSVDSNSKSSADVSIQNSKRAFWDTPGTFQDVPGCLLKGLFISDVSPVPASCDSPAVSLWPLHRAGGAVVEERGLVAGAKPAGSVHRFQTHPVQLLET